MHVGMYHVGDGLCEKKSTPGTVGNTYHKHTLHKVPHPCSPAAVEAANWTNREIARLIAEIQRCADGNEDDFGRPLVSHVSAVRMGATQKGTRLTLRRVALGRLPLCNFMYVVSTLPRSVALCRSPLENCLRRQPISLMHCLGF